MEVKDEVELTNIAKVLVEYLYERLHEFEHDQLILVLVDNGNEVETGKALVDYLVFLIVQEVAHLGITRDDHLVYLPQPHPTSFRMRCFYD